MAEIGSGSGSNDGNEGFWLRDEVESTGPRIDDQTTEGTSASIGAGVPSGDGGTGGHAQEVGDGGNRRMPVEEGCTLSEAGHMPIHLGAVGPRIQCLDSRSAMECIMITDGGLGGASGRSSGSSGGDVLPDSPPRDPMRGKGVVTAQEPSGEVPMGPMEFRPATESSGHRPLQRVTSRSMWTRRCSPAC